MQDPDRTFPFTELKQLLRILLFFPLCLLLLTQMVPAYADSPITHTVAWGETLYSIARSYGLTPQAIAKANGISVNSWMYAGQHLTIPVAGAKAETPRLTPSGYYTVRAGDTLFSIATRYGLSVAALATANNLPADGVIYVGWSLKIPAAAAPPSVPTTATQIHIVQQGEYLSQIALRYGTTVAAITLANNLPNEWLIFAGQRLTIPGSQSAGTAAVAPAASAVLNVRATNIPLYQQKQTLTCEESSVAMATRGAVSEASLVAAMPRSDNPFAGIRGKTNSPYYGGLSDYGAYAQAIQKGLNALGVKSTLLYGQSYDDFRDSVTDYLQAGRGVVWWHTWHDTYQNPVTVKTSDGASVKLVPYEHAGVIVAANDKGVTYNDPYDATVRFVSWADWKRVSAYFDNMALVIQ